MEGEDRKDLWRELVTVCGGSKDSICKFRFFNMTQCVSDHGHDDLDCQYLWDSVCKFRF